MVLGAVQWFIHPLVEMPGPPYWELKFYLRMFLKRNITYQPRTFASPPPRDLKKQNRNGKHQQGLEFCFFFF